MGTLKYDDLLSVPFKPYGRDKDGMDCYGFDIELCRRAGNPLKDIVGDWKHRKIADLENYLIKLNVEEINKPEKHCIVQNDYKGELHMGFMLDSKTVIHMTYEGVRVVPLFLFGKSKFYRVIK